MKSLVLILTTLSLLSQAQDKTIINWNVGQCEGNPYELPYEYAVGELIYGTKSSQFTFKFVENCSLVPEFEINLKNNKVYISLTNKSDIGSRPFCDCCYSVIFTIKGKIDKNTKFYHNNKQIVNLSDPHPYINTYDIVNGDTVNRYNDQGQKQGLWDIEGHRKTYSNGLLVNYVRKHAHGNFYYQNLLESYYVINSDTFNMVDKFGKEQGLHIEADLFADLDSSRFQINYVNYYKNGKLVLSYEPFQRHSSPCGIPIETIEFYGTTVINTGNPEDAQNYTYDGTGSFLLTNPKKFNLKLNTDTLHKGQSLEITAINKFYDFDFSKLVVINPDGKSIKLISHYIEYHKLEQLVGIDTNSTEKQVVVHTDRPSYQMVLHQNPKRLKDPSYKAPDKVFDSVFKRFGLYEIRYYREPCKYERVKVYYAE